MLVARTAIELALQHLATQGSLAVRYGRRNAAPAARLPSQGEVEEATEKLHHACQSQRWVGTNPLDRLLKMVSGVLSTGRPSPRAAGALPSCDTRYYWSQICEN